MKVIGPIAGIDSKNTMTEIYYAKGIDLWSIIKMSMKEGFIIHFRTMEIGKNIKIVMKTSTGMKISMIVIDLMIQIIPKVEIGHMTEPIQKSKRRTRNPKCRGRRDRCPKDRQGTKL